MSHSGSCALSRLPISSTPRGRGLARLSMALRGASMAMLLAAVVAGCGQRSTASHVVTPITTVPATPDRPTWTSLGHYDGAPRVTIVPSQPTTAYRVSLLVLGKGSAPDGIEMTTDAGATWRKLTLPVALDPTLAQDAGVGFDINPLNASMLYVTMPVSPGPCQPAARQRGFAQLSAGATRSSAPACLGHFVTADSGKTWRTLTLPAPGMLGSTPVNFTNAPGIVHPQGTRLYAMANPPFFGQDVSPPAGRLITSVDGGLTWRLADGGLPTTVGIMDYAPAVTGSAVYVVAEGIESFNAQACCMPPPHAKLWRSDDAGAHWGFVAAWPLTSFGAPLAVPQAGSATPLLYAGPDPYIKSQPVGLRVSADGGLTWQIAPTTDLNPRVAVGMESGIKGVLPDGSVIVSFEDRTGNTGALYAWKHGASGWRFLASKPPLATTIDQVSVRPAPDGHGITLLALYQTPDGTGIASVTLPG